MVKLKYLLIYLFVSLTFSGISQEEFKYLNVFKLSPIEFANSEFQFSYERYFNNRKSSIIITPSILLKDQGEESFSGVQAMVQYRLYLTHLQKGIHKTLQMHNIGFYGGPYVLGLTYQEDYSSGYFDLDRNEFINKLYHKDIKAIEGGAIMGIQLDITERIVLDMFVGGGIRYANVDDDILLDQPDDNYFYYDVFDVEYTGVKPKLGLQLGITF
jgi:hypothetical protein